MLLSVGPEPHGSRGLELDRLGAHRGAFTSDGATGSAVRAARPHFMPELEPPTLRLRWLHGMAYLRVGRPLPALSRRERLFVRAARRWLARRAETIGSSATARPQSWR